MKLNSQEHQSSVILETLQEILRRLPPEPAHDGVDPQVRVVERSKK